MRGHLPPSVDVQVHPEALAHVHTLAARRESSALAALCSSGPVRAHVPEQPAATAQAKRPGHRLRGADTGAGPHAGALGGTLAQTLLPILRWALWCGHYGLGPHVDPCTESLVY